MAKMYVTYYDVDGEELQVSVNADDEAAALGVVLDELGDTICSSSPFAVWRDRTPKRKAAGARKGKGRGELLSEPVPVDDGIIDDEQAQAMPSDAQTPAELVELFADLDIKLESAS